MNPRSSGCFLIKVEQRTNAAARLQAPIKLALPEVRYAIVERRNQVKQA